MSGRSEHSKDAKITKTEITKKSEVNSRRLLFSTKSKARQSKTKKARLVMSVASVLGRLKAGRYSSVVGATGAVYLAATNLYCLAFPSSPPVQQEDGGEGGHHPSPSPALAAR